MRGAGRGIHVSSRLRWTVAAVGVTLMALSLPSCVVCGEKYDLVDLTTENHTVELDGAESVVVNVDMGVGQLMIGGGAKELAEAEFRYNVAEWRPEISYEVVNGRGILHITQPDAEGGKSAPNKAENRWLIALSDDVEMELQVDSGVGEVKLDLGGLALTDLEVDHGVGEILIDLSGHRVSDMNATIDGGIGSIKVIVPSSVGVRLDGDTGIGSFKAAGFAKSGGAFVNDAYNRADTTIRLSIDAGIGEVKVLTDEA